MTAQSWCSFHKTDIYGFGEFQVSCKHGRLRRGGEFPFGQENGHIDEYRAE